MAGHKIFLVGIKAPLLAHIEERLVFSGYSTLTMDSGDRALRMLYETPPEIIIADAAMSDMTGYEFCRKLRSEAQSDIPVIFISPTDSVEEKLLSFMLGGDDYLIKPFVIDELLARIKVILKRVGRLKRESVKDTLTGLLNRGAIEARLNSEINRSLRFNRSFSLAMIDIDEFKRVNEAHGHVVGDKILRSLARYVVGNLRALDMVGRFCGEEFLLILPETNKNNAVTPLERLRSGLKNNGLSVSSNGGVRIGFSGGIAECPCDGASAEEIISAADAALYASKAGGRDMVTVFARN
ncbi:MAG: GGDEF domain-containing protein [Candidatus Nitrospinota bacterium M3_3B_026]